MRDRKWLRGVVTLGVLGALTGAIVASPVGAAFNPTKKKIKNIATKTATKVFNANIGPATAGLQENIHWARVRTDGTIASQSGGISVQSSAGDGSYYLHFPAVVADKAILATPYFPGDTDTLLSVFVCGDSPPCSEGTNTSSDLHVGTGDTDGIRIDRSFYVAVIH